MHPIVLRAVEQIATERRWLSWYLTFEGTPVPIISIALRSIRFVHIESIRGVSVRTSGAPNAGTIGGELATLGQARTKQQSMNKRVVFI